MVVSTRSQRFALLGLCNPRPDQFTITSSPPLRHRPSLRRCRTDLLISHDTACAAKVSSRLITAQALRAVLLAEAIAASLGGFRVSN